MRITKTQLRQIIKEELVRSMNESIIHNAMLAAAHGDNARKRAAADKEKAKMLAYYARNPIEHEVEEMPQEYWDNPSYMEGGPDAPEYKKRKEKWSQFGWLCPYALMKIRWGTRYGRAESLLETLPRHVSLTRITTPESLVKDLMNSFDEEGNQIDQNVAQDIAQRWFNKTNHPLGSDRDPLEDELDF